MADLCIRERISYLDCVEGTDTNKGSVFFAQLGVSVQFWYNQQRWIYGNLFQEPFHEWLLELFFPREINRKLSYFGLQQLMKYFYTTCLCFFITYACIGDFVFIASSFQYVLFISKMISWVFKILSLQKWVYFGAHLSRDVAAVY